MELKGRGGGRPSGPPPPDFVVQMLERDFGNDTKEFKKALSQVSWSVLEQDNFRSDMRELSKQTGILAFLFNKAGVYISDENRSTMEFRLFTGSITSPFQLLVRICDFHKHSDLISDIIGVIEKRSLMLDKNFQMDKSRCDMEVVKMLLSAKIPDDLMAKLNGLLDGPSYRLSNHFNQLFNWDMHTRYKGWEMIPRILYNNEEAPGLLDSFHKRCEERQKLALMK